MLEFVRDLAPFRALRRAPRARAARKALVLGDRDRVLELAKRRQRSHENSVSSEAQQ
jgi:hypothetical protein